MKGYQYTLAHRVRESCGPGMALFFAQVARRKKKPWKGKDRQGVQHFYILLTFSMICFRISLFNKILKTIFVLFFQIDTIVKVTSWYRISHFPQSLTIVSKSNKEGNLLQY